MGSGEHKAIGIQIYIDLSAGHKANTPYGVFMLSFTAILATS